MAIALSCASQGVHDQRGGFGNVVSELPVVRGPSSLQPRLPTLARELRQRVFVLRGLKRGPSTRWARDY